MLLSDVLSFVSSLCTREHIASLLSLIQRYNPYISHENLYMSSKSTSNSLCVMLLLLDLLVLKSVSHKIGLFNF